MKDLIDKIEVSESYVYKSLKCLSESKFNALNQEQSDYIIRFLVKKVAELEQKIDQIQYKIKTETR